MRIQRRFRKKSIAALAAAVLVTGGASMAQEQDSADAETTPWAGEPVGSGEMSGEVIGEPVEEGAPTFSDSLPQEAPESGLSDFEGEPAPEQAGEVELGEPLAEEPLEEPGLEAFEPMQGEEFGEAAPVEEEPLAEEPPLEPMDPATEPGAEEFPENSPLYQAETPDPTEEPIDEELPEVQDESAVGQEEFIQPEDTGEPVGMNPPEPMEPRDEELVEEHFEPVGPAEPYGINDPEVFEDVPPVGSSDPGAYEESSYEESSYDGELLDAPGESGGAPVETPEAHDLQNVGFYS